MALDRSNSSNLEQLALKGLSEFKSLGQPVFLPERDYVIFGSLLSQIRLSYVVCQGLKYSFAILYLSHPLTSLQVAKFYGDGLKGTPPSGALNARGVAK